jgi:hypothetical protein
MWSSIRSRVNQSSINQMVYIPRRAENHLHLWWHLSNRIEGCTEIGSQGDGAAAGNRQDTSTVRRTSHGKYLLRLSAATCCPSAKQCERGSEVAASTLGPWLMIAKGGQKGTKGMGIVVAAILRLAFASYQSSSGQLWHAACRASCLLFRAHLSQIPVQDVTYMHVYKNSPCPLNFACLGRIQI